MQGLNCLLISSGPPASAISFAGRQLSSAAAAAKMQQPAQIYSSHTATSYRHRLTWLVEGGHVDNTDD